MKTFYAQKIILRNDPKEIKAELEDVVDINERNVQHQTALHTAAGHCSNPEIALMLLRKGACWDILDKVCTEKTAESQRYIIKNISLQTGCAPIHLAARRGQLSIVKTLVEWDSANAELPAGEESEKKLPVHFACEEDRLDVILYLKEDAKGAVMCCYAISKHIFMKLMSINATMRERIACSLALSTTAPTRLDLQLSLEQIQELEMKKTKPPWT